MALHNDMLAQQMWQFLCNDIDSCLTVNQDMQALGAQSKFKGGLNFPAALTMFAMIDLAASYYVGRGATTSDIAEFISRYFGPHSPKLADEKLAKKWYEVFRNGLTHQWSPKAGGVGMTFHPEVFIFVSPPGAEKIPILIVPTLFDVLKKALHAYEADLDSNPALRQKFEHRYQALVQADYKEMRILREMCGE
jgi:hypothetical protein